MPQQRRFVPDRLPEATAPNLPDDRRAAVLPDHDLDDEGTYRDMDFLDLDLTGRTARSVELEGCHLKATDLSGSRVTRCELVDIDGVTSMRGAVVEGHNLVALAHTLATALGITIDAED